MDLGAILTTVVIVAAAGGSWFQGRNNGTSTALSTASDVVGMLATRVALLESENRAITLERDECRARNSTLAGYREASERCRETDCPGRAVGAASPANG